MLPCDLPRGVSSGSIGGGGGRRVGQVGGGHKEMQPLRTRWPSVWGPPRALRSEGGAGHFHSEDAADQSGLGSGRTGQPNRSRAEPSRAEGYPFPFTPNNAMFVTHSRLRRSKYWYMNVCMYVCMYGGRSPGVRETCACSDDSAFGSMARAFPFPFLSPARSPRLWPMS